MSIGNVLVVVKWLIRTTQWYIKTRTCELNRCTVLFTANEPTCVKVADLSISDH